MILILGYMTGFHELHPWPMTILIRKWKLLYYIIVCIFIQILN
jgi:hypothetical protein